MWQEKLTPMVTPIYPSPENIILGKCDEEGGIMFPWSNYSVLWDS